jgi:membrane-associated progesterone receptor component
MQYFLILVLVVAGYFYTSASMFSADKAASSTTSAKSSDTQEEEDKSPDPPRNFSLEQLAYFDGTVDTSVPKRNDSDPDVLKPVYLSVNGTVFDCSDGRNFYGPGGPYEVFAGHECGVALAKMSFDSKDLDDLDGCAALSFGEKVDLDGWIDKFTYYRCYPVKGRLVPADRRPSPNRIWTLEELSMFTGKKQPNAGDNANEHKGEKESCETDEAGTGRAHEKSAGSSEVHFPDGYATPPIYIAVGEDVFDVSFGGASFYGEGGPYHRFAGKNASRALAKMSFDEENLVNPDVSDLDEKEMKILNDWIKTLRDKKKYPVVGKIVVSVTPEADSSASKSDAVSTPTLQPEGNAAKPDSLGTVGSTVDEAPPAQVGGTSKETSA